MSCPAERLRTARHAIEAGQMMRLTGADSLVAALDLAEAGRFDVAADRLAALAAAEDASPPAHLFLALALDAAGRRTEAKKELVAALENGFEDYDCLCLAGDALTDWGMAEEAVLAYDRAIAIAPHSSHAHLQRGKALSICGDIGSAIRDMRRATLLQPNLTVAHLALADELCAAGLLEDGLRSYRQALAIEPENIKIRNGLEAALTKAVPPWHMAMLNDEGRNAAFEGAIRRAVKPGMHVLDIGTGSGLLAMMAARAGAARVTACESVATLAERAQTIVARNGFAERIDIVARRSGALSIGDGLDGPADLVVAEIVDCGLLSEGVIETIADARDRLMKPGAATIPASAALFAMPVESPELLAALRVGTVSGFDLSDFNELAPRVYRQIELDRYRWRPLAAPVELFAFDFASARPVPETREIGVAPISDGTAHAIVMWFRLILDAETVIATGPFDPPTHWKQAVFAADPPRELKQGEPARLSASHDGRLVRLTLGGAGER